MKPSLLVLALAALVVAAAAGTTARSAAPPAAAAEPPCGCRPAPNDYYILDETHRLLTFAVRRDARVVVLTRGSQATTRISVLELAQIVQGRNPRHRRLLEPKAGFWIQTGERYPNPI